MLIPLLWSPNLQHLQMLEIRKTWERWKTSLFVALLNARLQTQQPNEFVKIVVANVIMYAVIAIWIRLAYASNAKYPNLQSTLAFHEPLNGKCDGLYILVR